MKSILSGVTLEKYLEMKTLLAKVIGLIFAAGSGIIIYIKYLFYLLY